MEMNLKIKIGSLVLKNPIITASGTFGYGLEFADKFDISKLGAIVTKGLSIEPREGNDMPRICETPAGMLNSIGLQNVGLKVFEKEKLPELRKLGATVIVNFFGETEDEYIKAAGIIDSMDGVSALEMNVSCPNVEKGGIQFGSDPSLLEKLTADVRKVVSKPLIVKLSPNVADIKPFAKGVENGGADAISAINTLIGMSVDIKTKKPKLSRVMGGLSGPAIKPVAVRMVYESAKIVNIPVIGIGGITNLDDVLEFLIAGASAVEIGTFNFIDPTASIDILEKLSGYMKKNSITDITDITGSIKA